MENIIDNNKHSGRKWSGLVILVIGLAFLLDNLGLDIPAWIFSWTTFLILLGVVIGIRRNFKGIGWLILILVGTYNTLDNIPGLGFDISKYALGIGLVILGGFLIFRPKYYFEGENRFKKRFRSKFSSTDPGLPGETDKSSIYDHDIIDVTAVFGGSHQTVYTKNFKGGDITAVFGGADINLTQADFAESVVLDVTAIFGGIKLIVPQNWAIKSNVTAFFGSVEDKRSFAIPQEGIQKTLILDGTVLFGGIEIKSF